MNAMVLRPQIDVCVIHSSHRQVDDFDSPKPGAISIDVTSFAPMWRLTVLEVSLRVPLTNPFETGGPSGYH